MGCSSTVAFSLWPLGRARRGAGREPVPRPRVAPASSACRGSRSWRRSRRPPLGLARLLPCVTAPDRSIAGWFVRGAIATLSSSGLPASAVMAAARRVGEAGAAAGLAPRACQSAPPRRHLPAASCCCSASASPSSSRSPSSRAIWQHEVAGGAAAGRRRPISSSTFSPIRSPGSTGLMASYPGRQRFRSACPACAAASRASTASPVEQVKVASGAQWALNSERGLTYAAQPPKGSRIIAGNGGRRIITDRRSSRSMPIWRRAWGSRSATRSPSICSAARSRRGSPICARSTGPRSASTSRSSSPPARSRRRRRPISRPPARPRRPRRRSSSASPISFPT